MPYEDHENEPTVVSPISDAYGSPEGSDGGNLNVEDQYSHIQLEKADRSLDDQATRTLRNSTLWGIELSSDLTQTRGTGSEDGGRG